MVDLYDKNTGAYLGRITDGQFKFLRDELEEESENDTDYYINVADLEPLEQKGADPELLEALLKGLRGREEMEIRWEAV